LKSYFEQIGHVESARIIRDSDSGESKGFGYCEFGNDHEVQQAVERLDGTELLGRRIRVSRARQ
jgi:RNA recognition motif-containing protein